MPSDTAPAVRPKSTLLAWALNVPFVAVVGLLFWYDMPMLMQLVCGLGIIVPMGHHLWRHYVGGEPQQYLVAIWFAFVCGVAGTAFTLKYLLAHGI